MKLSKRLLSLAGYVEADDYVADVGCDHAYLSIYLVKNKLVRGAEVSDVNLNALNNGINNIKKHHLEGKIKAKLSDGIKSIGFNVNALILSGMGSSTIIKILDNSKLSQINKLIIQSNNDYYLLRKWITNSGFYISAENVVWENDIYYVNIVFLRGKRNYTLKELKYGPLLILSNRDYYKHLYLKEIDILRKIPKFKILLRLQHLKEKSILKKLLK